MNRYYHRSRYFSRQPDFSVLSMTALYNSTKAFYYWSMGKILKILTPLLGIVFFLYLFIAVRTLLFNPLSFPEDLPPSPGKIRSFHYSLFLPSSDHSFFSDLKRGATDAANAMDCAVSFGSVLDEPLGFEMAPYSGIDGVAVFVYDKNPEIIRGLKRLSDSKIPVVQIENEVLVGSGTFLIGTNSFDSGKSIGRIAGYAQERSLKIGLVYSEKNPGLMSDANLVEIGLKTMTGDRLSQLFIATTSLNPIDAERVVYDMVRRHPDIDIIALTDIHDTLVTIQAIIDLNMVGRIQIIGSGEDDTIREYISKGVVLGTLVRNPYRIGYSAVMALKEISTAGYTSAYIDTGINILTKTEIQSSIGGGQL